MDQTATKIKTFLDACSEDERRDLFKHLRSIYQIHELETAFGAPAEIILEAIHRAPELTRRMLRGVIADAAFAEYIVPTLAAHGWKDATPEGNWAYDYRLDDVQGPVTIQVKLQRSERGEPVIKKDMFVVETQRSRTGTKKVEVEGVVETALTRPYRYGEFDVIAVSLQPSTGDWKRFRYSVGDWLLPGKKAGDIATLQPVAMKPNEDWTDDFRTVAKWFRGRTKKTIARNVDLLTLL